MIAVIGDEHGRNKFVNIYNKIKDKKYIEYIICLGDYFDPYNKISICDLIDNFNNICSIAREDKRVKLLIGNHDMHYLINSDKSRYDYDTAPIFFSLFSYNMDLLNITFKYKDILISHAGVSNEWMENNNLKNYDEINELFHSYKSVENLKRYEKAFTYAKEDISNLGDHKLQSPLWIRPKSLLESEWNCTTQIVGHTRTDWLGLGNYLGLPTFKPNEINKVIRNNKILYLCDTGDNEEYLEII